MLFEQRMLFFSNDEALLVPVIEVRDRCLTCARSAARQTFFALLYPFKWQHVYVPVLPGAMRSFAEAIWPFIAGINSKYAKDVGDCCAPSCLMRGR